MYNLSSKIEKKYFCVTYDKLHKSLKIEVIGLRRQDQGLITLITSDAMPYNEAINATNLEDLALRCKGIVIEQSEAGGVRIYNDPFCTIPVYFLEKDDDITVSSSPQQLISYNKTDIDPAGFWETAIFGTGIWTRTPFRNLFQLPSACRLDIDKKINVSRYWDFAIEENSSITSLDNAADKLHEILLNLFSNINMDKEYHMGLSGGLDSRLSLAYLSNSLSSKNINLFTFGFDERILEFKYANSVAIALGFKGSTFHRLDAKAYRDALDFLPVITAGEISIAHCHILSYFINNNYSDKVQLSNYYSDAVFGYAATYPKQINPFLNPYSKKLKSFKFIDPHITEIILNDIEHMCSGFQKSSNFSSINEYIYVTERNPKFHMKLSYIQDYLIKTIAPYANVDLLKFMISVPLKFREQKILVDAVCNKYYPSISGNRINQQSSRFQPRFSKYREWLKFRLLNLSNGLLRIGTSGHVQLFNKFQTEEQERLLFTSFYKELKQATSNFLELGLLNKDAKKYYDHLPLRSTGTSERYSLITLAKLFSA